MNLNSKEAQEIILKQEIESLARLISGDAAFLRRQADALDRIAKHVLERSETSCEGGQYFSETAALHFNLQTSNIARAMSDIAARKAKLSQLSE
jgi:hypothetical protein